MPLSDYELDRSVPIPLYYQLKTFILSEIKNSNFPVGSNIPTEMEISEHFQVSRSTVRQAINELVQEGYLERQTSRGTYVIEPEEKVGYIRSFEPFYQQVRRTGQEAKTQLSLLEVVEADETIAANLDIKPGEKAICMSRRRFSGDTPMVLMQNYLPYSLCSFILSHNFETESLYEVLSHHQDIRHAETKTIVIATLATSEDAHLLDIKKGAPILCFNTITKTDNGQIVNFAYSRYRGDLNRFEIDAKPD